MNAGARVIILNLKFKRYHMYAYNSVFSDGTPPPSPTHMYAYINRFFSDGNSPKIVLSI